MNARIPDEYAQFEEGPGSGQAFNFTPQIVSPQWSPGPVTIGSTFGVPPATHIAGMEPSTTSQAGTAYASAVMQRGAGSHPVLWAIIIFSLGFILLGSLAHFETKRRG